MAVQSSCKFLSLLIFFALSSCAKNEVVGNHQEISHRGETLINATISASTRTSLDGLKVNWGKDDVIETFISSDSYPFCFHLEDGAGSSSAKFTGSISGNPVFVKYPFHADDRYCGGYISTKLPESQEYVPGGFAPGISPMAAIPDDEGNACFRNLCSVIRITLTGKVSLDEIVLSTEDDGCYLAGPAKIKIVDNVPVLCVEPNNAEASIHTEGDGYTSVHMECKSLQLSTVIPATFCFVVPAQVYEGGLLLEVRTSLGTFSKHTGKLDLKSSTLYDLEPVDVIINGDIEPSSFLKGSGTSSLPYLVSSVEDILYIQSIMASKGYITDEDGKQGKAAMSAWYLLTEDVDLSRCCGPRVGSWKPLTVQTNSFVGHFDGGGHKITGLYVNSDEGKGSFFGDVYSNGYLGNLEVEGDVSAESSAIVCGSVYGTIENCIARGKSTSHNFGFAGGIAISNYGTINNCVNFASVQIDGNLYLPAGGIASSGISASFINCVNYGAITSKTGNCLSGGISAKVQGSVIFNCVNYGWIIGKTHSAGIVGSVFQTDVANCANYGIIQGADPSITLCGGICGEQSDPFSSRTGTISNCINVGDVSDGFCNCGICAKNVRVVQYCYWLYDVSNSVSTGASGGTITSLVSLDRNQMKGQSSSSSLYGGYTNIVDALNAYAFEKSTLTNSFQGWMFDFTSGWPILTGRTALPPGQQDKFIKTNKSSYILNTMAQSIELAVTSSSDVSINLPDWILSKSVKKEINGVIFYSTYNLEVQQNKTGGEREDSIIITGDDGTSVSVDVVQRYTYISHDYSRNGNIVTLQKASEGAGIDIVMMGDAYTDKDISDGKYESDMKRGIDAFFSVEPYASFRNLFNIYYVEVVSNSNEIDGSTAFSSYFGDGTLVGGNDTKVRGLCNSVTKKSCLDDVTAIVIVNTKRYAGTCYMYYCYSGDYGLGFSISYFPLGTSTTGQTSMEALIRHEAAGHGFGKLADEYSYQYMGAIPNSEITDYRNRQSYGWWLNIDFTSDPFKVRWTKYIQDNRYSLEQIDVYEGGATYWSGVWRPTTESIMRHNTGQFNAPSREAIYNKIHRLAYGSNWTYDHETFVAYDAVNRSAAVAGFKEPSAVEIASFHPTHPPVLIREDKY